MCIKTGTRHNRTVHTRSYIALEVYVSTYMTFTKQLRILLVHTMYMYCTWIVHVSMACFIMDMYCDKTVCKIFKVTGIQTVNLIHTARLFRVFRPLRYERNHPDMWIYFDSITILNSWRGLTWSLVSNVWRRPCAATRSSHAVAGTGRQLDFADAWAGFEALLGGCNVATYSCLIAK